MRALRQEVDEELHVGVGVALIIADTVVALVPRDLLQRLEASGAQILNKHKTHVLAAFNGDLHRELVADFQGALSNRDQQLAIVGDGFHEDLTLDLEAGVVGLHLVDRHEILPEQAAPDQMRGGVDNGEMTHVVGDLVGVPVALDKASASLAALSADGRSAETQGDILALLEPIAAAQQQGVDGIGGRSGVLPHVGALLREQPHPQLVEHLLVAFNLGKGAHDVGMGGDVRVEREVLLGPIHADFIVLLGTFLERLDD